jgi:hypothetical protein
MTGAGDNHKTKSKTKKLTCKLTTPELSERKASVIANLKKQIILTRELKNGFAYRFPAPIQLLMNLQHF